MNQVITLILYRKLKLGGPPFDDDDEDDPDEDWLILTSAVEAFVGLVALKKPLLLLAKWLDYHILGIY